MKINQELVNKILSRAEASKLGLEGPTSEISLEKFEPNDDSFALSSALVGAFNDKYDLISIFAAMWDELSSENERLRHEQG